MLYAHWCEATKISDQRKRYWSYTERPGGREAIAAALATVVRSHYDRLDRIADDVSRLGYLAAATVLRALMPTSPRGRSGDLGEILATQLVEEEVGLRVPIRRLRYKDGRDMAMRGDDFIGAGYDAHVDRLRLLKGEAKSGRSVGRRTVAAARAVLDRDGGRCTPASLLFVANRLLESPEPADNELGRRVRDEVGLGTLSADAIGHMLFTLSGNDPHEALQADLDAAGGDRDQFTVNVRVEDHRNFVSATYVAASTIGDD
jgi:hypothetical protein